MAADLTYNTSTTVSIYWAGNETQLSYKLDFLREIHVRKIVGTFHNTRLEPYCIWNTFSHQNILTYTYIYTLDATVSSDAQSLCSTEGHSSRRACGADAVILKSHWSYGFGRQPATRPHGKECALRQRISQSAAIHTTSQLRGRRLHRF